METVTVNNKIYEVKAYNGCIGFLDYYYGNDKIKIVTNIFFTNKEKKIKTLQTYYDRNNNQYFNLHKVRYYLSDFIRC